MPAGRFTAHLFFYGDVPWGRQHLLGARIFTTRKPRNINPKVLWITRSRGYGLTLKMRDLGELLRVDCGKLAQAAPLCVVRSGRGLQTSSSMVVCGVQAFEHRQAGRETSRPPPSVRVGRANDNAAWPGDVRDALA
jgi:hypothetical protein